MRTSPINIKSVPPFTSKSMINRSRSRERSPAVALPAALTPAKPAFAQQTLAAAAPIATHRYPPRCLPTHDPQKPPPRGRGVNYRPRHPPTCRPACWGCLQCEALRTHPENEGVDDEEGFQTRYHGFGLHSPRCHNTEIPAAGSGQGRESARGGGGGGGRQRRRREGRGLAPPPSGCSLLPTLRQPPPPPLLLLGLSAAPRTSRSAGPPPAPPLAAPEPHQTPQHCVVTVPGKAVGSLRTPAPPRTTTRRKGGHPPPYPCTHTSAHLCSPRRKAWNTSQGRGTVCVLCGAGRERGRESPEVAGSEIRKQAVQYHLLRPSKMKTIRNNCALFQDLQNSLSGVL